MKRREFLASLIVLGVATKVPLPKTRKPQSKTIFVDSKNGKDSYDGMSIDKPKKTLGSALEIATPNSMIFLRGSQ